MQIEIKIKIEIEEWAVDDCQLPIFRIYLQ